MVLLKAVNIFHLFCFFFKVGLLETSFGKAGLEALEGDVGKEMYIKLSVVHH